MQIGNTNREPGKKVTGIRYHELADKSDKTSRTRNFDQEQGIGMEPCQTNREPVSLVAKQIYNFIEK